MKPAFKLFALALACTLAACTTQQQTKFSNAVTTPLSDLNLSNLPVPELLKTAQRAPYALPQDRSCHSLAGELGQLTDLLGPDVDVPADGEQLGLVERGAQESEREAVAAVQRTAESVIPFRSWVRKLTGAERHFRQVAAAVAAGSARRAFLKGLAAAQGCE